MAPKENESTLFSSMSNIEEQNKNSFDNKEVSKTNNNDNDNNIYEKSFWQRTSEMMEQMEQEMQTLIEGKDVKFLEREDSDEQVKLSFELDGLTSEEIKISMTASNFLEIEYLQKDKDNNEEGPSYIWAYPLEQGLNVGEMSHTFTEEGKKLIVTVPKDPDFKPDEEVEEENNNEENSEEVESQEAWVCPFWPFAMTPANEDNHVQTVQPIEANIDENDEQFQIEMKIDGFKADEIQVRLCQNRVLIVTGERKKKNPENPESSEYLDEENNKLSRKSFGRMFWIPDDCKKEEIVAKTRMENAILILNINVPKGEEESDNGQESRDISIKQY